MGKATKKKSSGSTPRKKRNTEVVDVNQIKITNFFKKVDPKVAASVPSGRNKLSIQSRLSFSNVCAGTSSSVSTTGSMLKFKKAKTKTDIHTKRRKKDLIVITDSEGNDVIIISDSDDDHTDVNKKVDKQSTQQFKENSSKFSIINTESESEIDTDNTLSTLDIGNDSQSDDSYSRSSQGIEVEDKKDKSNGIRSNKDFVRSFSKEKSQKTVSLTSEQDTQKLDGSDSEFGLRGIEVQGATSVCRKLFSEGDEISLPAPLQIQVKPIKEVRITVDSDSHSPLENERAYSPSLLENYKPSPNLFEDQGAEFSNKNEVWKSQSNSTRSSEHSASPTRLRKSSVPYFSPIRHLNKPSRKFNTQLQSPISNMSTATITNIGSSSINMNRNTTAVKQKLMGQNCPDPYYLESFKTIINSVASDDFHGHLFSEADRKQLESFDKFNKHAKCLYVRLFNRQWRWKQAAGIKYPEIVDNLLPAFEELYQGQFLLEIQAEKVELDVLLDILTGEQIATVSKKMQISTAFNTKEKIKLELMKMTKQQRTLKGSSSEVIRKLALELLGPTFLISENSRNLFTRILIISAPPQYWDDDADKMSHQLLTILLTDIGKMDYPSYKISKATRIYQSRDDLLRFQDAWKLHSDVQCQLVSKQWVKVERIGQEALQKLKVILETHSIKQYDECLPNFLRVYTAGSVYTRTIWLGVDALQKSKQYLKANEIIEVLAKQTTYLTHYRGRWHERLILNAKQHLKLTNSTIWKLIVRALNDQFLQDSHRLGITVRLEKIIASKATTLSKIRKLRKKKRGKIHLNSDSNDESDDDPTTDEDFNTNGLKLCVLKNKVPSRIIEGEKMSIMNERKGGKSIFKCASGTLDEDISSVELFTINYFKRQGYIHGVHGEGSVPTTIFGLLFWSIIYCDEIPDVFYSSYQPFPLDIHFEEFYDHRREQIEGFLFKLRNTYSLNDVFELIDDNWEKYFNKISIVNWPVFQSAAHIKSLIIAMGLEMVASICERLAQNFRYFRSGFPDLVVWNESECIFVEVKGPGDTLSAKQSLWLDFLVSIGARAEVCHVKSVSNKRIRLMTGADPLDE